MSTSYRVDVIEGCRIVYGSIPVDDLTAMTKRFSEKALMDMHMASKLGAAFVIGEPEDLKRLKEVNLPPSQERQRVATNAKIDAKINIDGKVPSEQLQAVQQWLLQGERGLSSEAMCHRFFGVPAIARKNHPMDAGDLRRCVLFLDATHSWSMVELMRDVSPEWARLVGAWGELTGMLREEMAAASQADKETGARNRTRSQVYDRMREILRD